MAHANVNLSKEEMELVKTPDFILTKNHIISKVMHLMANIYERYISITKTNKWLQNESAFNKGGKIFKGEQYESLPYVTLDYPRNFSGRDIFAVRSFFWWGNFFSITLHVSGEFAQKYFTGIMDGILKNPAEWYVCINDNEWHHHFNSDNYMPAHTFIEKEKLEILLREKPFIKTARKTMLENWENAEDFFESAFSEITGWLRFNCLNGETDLLPGIPIKGSDL